MANNQKDTKKMFHYAFVILAVLCMIKFAAGGIYALGDSLFYAPIATDLHTGRANVALIKAFKNFAILFILPFAGRIMDRYNPKIVFSLAILIMGITYTVQCTYNSLWLFYLSAAIGGLGAGIILYPMIPFLVNRWFGTSIGLAIGIAYSCSDLGNLIFSPFAGYLIDNYGWRTGMLVMGIIGLVLTIPFTAIFLKSSPADMGLSKYGASKEGQSNPGHAVAAALTGFSLKKAAKTPAFYITIFSTFTLTLIANLQMHIPGHVVALGYKALVAGTVMSAVSVGAVIAKPLWGFMSDKIGLRATLLCAEACAIISAIIFLMGNNLTFLYTAGFFFGLTYVMINVYPPLVVKKLFGDLEFASIYSYIVYGNALAAIAGSYFFGWVFDTFGSYKFSFYAVIGLSFITTACYLWALSYNKKYESLWSEKEVA